MVTPHLPPEQSANALLPVMLGDELKSHGVETSYVTHGTSVVRRSGREDAVYVPRRGRSTLGRTFGGAAVAGGRMLLGARHAIAASDVVHLHSNGLIIEAGAFLARRYHKPYVITLYGTDVWHHEPERHARFGKVVREAAHRVFYSQALLDFAGTRDLVAQPSSVIYAPVPPAFRRLDPAQREAARRELGVADELVLLTVKRLHPVAGHDDLLRALPHVIDRRSNVRLWIAGDGELRPTLEATARDLRISAHVRFLGLVENSELWRYYGAADLFVLPSRLESWGAVMLESLACGTPVVATNTAGGFEVQRHFPEDVTLVERENPTSLADGIDRAIQRGSRTSEATLEKLRTEFNVSTCARRYLAVYQQACPARANAG